MDKARKKENVSVSPVPSDGDRRFLRNDGSASFNSTFFFTVTTVSASQFYFGGGGGGWSGGYSNFLQVILIILQMNLPRTGPIESTQGSAHARHKNRASRTE